MYCRFILIVTMSQRIALYCLQKRQWLQISKCSHYQISCANTFILLVSRKHACNLCKPWCNNKLCTKGFIMVFQYNIYNCGCAVQSLILIYAKHKVFNMFRGKNTDCDVTFMSEFYCGTVQQNRQSK